MATRTFDLLTPHVIVSAVEQAYGLSLDGTLTAYPSYVNRVYGLRAVDGRELIVKFYRPGRWSRDCILDEHRFLADCARAEVPVVAPLDLAGGESLGELVVEDEDGGFFFAVFPKMGGRNFDAEAEGDWRRLGSILGRLHLVGSRARADARPVCGPLTLTKPLYEGLLAEGLVHPDLSDEFESICASVLEPLGPVFASLGTQRIHGDCHRGNILDRPGEGLLLIDFDDMMTGPAIQDLWLLLPDHADKCRRELGLLVEGYEAFLPLDPREPPLIEGLRFMRMVYFLGWRARQRNDRWFRESFPDWGSKAFWTTELEDLRDQAELALQASPLSVLPPPCGEEGEDEAIAPWES